VTHQTFIAMCTVCPIGQSAINNPQGTIGLTGKRTTT